MFTHSLIWMMFTQFAVIEGQVRDARTHGAIPLARVELWHAQLPVDGQYTDSEGRFRFAYPTGGRYMISADSSGYVPSAVEIDTSPARSVIDIELVPNKPSPTKLQPVIGVREYLVPKNARNEFDRARKEAKQQNCSRAIPHFENGLRIFDQDASAHNDLGNCYRKLGLLDRAEDSFRQARALSNSVYVSLNLAEVYTAQKRFKEAEAVLLEAVQSQSNAGDAYYGLALVYFEQGRLEDAERSALLVDRYPHQIPDVHLVLAEIYWRQQKSAEATQQLESYLKEAPNGTHSERVRQVLKDRCAVPAKAPAQKQSCIR
ncbi:MAG: hypothetical protein DMG14_25680 [Acidobacteria bacterium]|nr:MAG: hypothetical protein DMG14_25680 [Acidobacteriota bacterium]